MISPSKTIVITAPGGFLNVDSNLVTLSAKNGDVVRWDVQVGDGLCVEILFERQHGTMGPFAHAGSDKNPGRGWYKVHGNGDIQTSAPDQSSGVWKYEVVLYDCESGQEIDRKDPYIKIGV
jgi:hypothetical protein